MGNTTALRRELKKRFYPFVADQKFEIDRTSSPFSIDFRRSTAEGVDVFDIQWEKSGSPRFVVNFGHCPSSGVIHFGEPVAPDKVLSYMGSSSGRLQPGKGSSTRSWFCQDRSFFHRVVLRRPPRPAAAVVDELLSLFPELQEWFTRRRLGPHMVMAHNSRRKQSAAIG